MDVDRVLMSVMYGVLAVIGICGNIWVLCLLLRQMLGKRIAHSNLSVATRLSSMQRAPSTATLMMRQPSIVRRQDKPSSTHLYLLLLSLTDLCCVATLPLLVIDINVHWVFGQTLCKVFYVSESLNKFMSPLILAALSFDRYLAVCRHGWRALRQMNVLVVAVLLACVTVACALMVPISMHSNVVYINDYNCVRISKCILDMPWTSRAPFIVFDGTQLLFCFVLPLTVICFAYTAILMRIWHHTRSSTIDGQSVISVGRVARCSALVVIFYFVCWSPYFLAQLHNILIDSYHSESLHPQVSLNGTLVNDHNALGCVPLAEPSFHADLSNALIRARYVLHALPYAQAAFNWLLYVYLNTSLRQSGRTQRTQSMVQTQAPTSMTNNGHCATAPSSRHSPRVPSPNQASASSDEGLQLNLAPHRTISVHFKASVGIEQIHAMDEGNCDVLL